MKKSHIISIICIAVAASCLNNASLKPSFMLIPAEKVRFNSFVDCNMAEAWIGDTFRIFPGKYG